MRNATHQAIGVASSFVATAAVGGGPSMCAIAATAALYGSRLPDVDQPGSRIHRRSRLERRHLVVRAIGLIVRLPMSIIALTVRHRGATHWLLTSAVITATLTVLAAALSPMLAPPVGLGVGLGYTAHLLADACTPPGAPLLGPFLGGDSTCCATSADQPRQHRTRHPRALCGHDCACSAFHHRVTLSRLPTRWAQRIGG
ncbi:MAG: metal-dependent hydrolase [Actinobacteria bacterium]|nr:metal-dependent hydrolase [Actinomycetota bacterium]